MGCASGTWTWGLGLCTRHVHLLAWYVDVGCVLTTWCMQLLAWYMYLGTWVVSLDYLVYAAASLVMYLGTLVVSLDYLVYAAASMVHVLGDMGCVS